MVHGKDKEFPMLCGIDGCRKDLHSFAFNSHVYRNHRQAMGLDKNEVPETSVITTDDECPSVVDVECNISLGAGEDFHGEGGYSRRFATECDKDTVRSWEPVRIFTAKAVTDFSWRITRGTVWSFF